MAIKQDVFPVAEAADVVDKALDKALSDLQWLSQQIERNNWELLRLKVRSVGEVFSAFSADGVLFVSPHGRILYSDRKIEKMFGYSADELNHQNLEMLIQLEQRNANTPDHETVKERPIEAALSADSLALRKDGSQSKIRLSLHSGKIEGESLLCLICTALE
jgi:PAS domain S-box-containing protein